MHMSNFCPFLSLRLLSYICNYRCALHNYCADGKTRWVALSEAGRLSLVRVGEERLQVRIFQVNQDGDDGDYDKYDDLGFIYLFLRCQCLIFLQVWIFQVNLDGDSGDDDLTISMMSWAHGT